MGVDVSIIMPAYNMATYIQASIQSVINQTYQNWELIVIDDGSTDQTRELIEALLPLDSRITLITQENKGVSATRNKGITCAKGLYISFLDADDYYHPQYIEEMVYPLKNEIADMTFCKFQEMDGNQLISKTPEELMALHNESFWNHITHYPHSRANMATMYSLKRIKSLSLLFNETISFAEDTEFVLKYALNAKVCFIPKYLYIYNYRVESASRGEFTPKRYLSAINAYFRVLKFAKNQNLVNSQLEFQNYMQVLIFNTHNNAKRLLWEKVLEGDFSSVNNFLTQYKKDTGKPFNVYSSGLKKITNWPKLAILRSQNPTLWKIFQKKQSL